jgi:hypothetical protein
VKGSTEGGKNSIKQGALKKSKEQETFTALNVVNSVFFSIIENGPFLMSLSQTNVKT